MNHIRFIGLKNFPDRLLREEVICRFVFASTVDLRIGPLQTQYWNWNWFGEGGGPNKGPVIFAADPKGQPRPTAREVLVTHCSAPHEPRGFFFGAKLAR
jgi:hypothetical protein